MKHIAKRTSLIAIALIMGLLLAGCSAENPEEDLRAIETPAAVVAATTTENNARDDSSEVIEYKWTAYEGMWLDFFANEEIPASIEDFDQFHAQFEALLSSKGITSQLETAKGLLGNDVQGYDDIEFTDFAGTTYVMNLESIELPNSNGNNYMRICFNNGDAPLFEYLKAQASEKFVHWETGDSYGKPTSVYKGSFESHIYTMSITFDESNIGSEYSNGIEINITADKEYIYKPKDFRYADMQYSTGALDAIIPEYVEFEKRTSFGTRTAQAVTNIYASLLPDNDGYVTPEMVCTYELGNSAVISESVINENGEYIDMTFAKTGGSTTSGETYQLIGLTTFSQTLLAPTDVSGNLISIATFEFKSFPNLIGGSKLFTDEYEAVTSTMIDSASADELSLTTYAKKQNLIDYSLEIITEDSETGFELYKQLCAALLQYYEVETNNVALALLPYWSDSLAKPDSSAASLSFQSITLSLPEDNRISMSFDLPEDFIIPSSSGALK